MTKRYEFPWETTISEEQAIDFVKNVCGEDEHGFYARYKRPDLVDLIHEGEITLTVNQLAGIVWAAKMNFKQMRKSTLNVPLVHREEL